MIIENMLQTPMIKRHAFNYLYAHMHELGFTIFTVYLYHVITHLINFRLLLLIFCVMQDKYININ